MKHLIRIAFLIAIIIVFLMMYVMIFSIDSFMLALSEPGFTLGEIIALIFGYSCIFHFIIGIYCIYHMFKTKKSVNIKIIFLFLFLFLPLIPSFIYFEKYIFKKEVIKKENL